MKKIGFMLLLALIGICVVQKKVHAEPLMPEGLKDNMPITATEESFNEKERAVAYQSYEDQEQ